MQVTNLFYFSVFIFPSYEKVEDCKKNQISGPGDQIYLLPIPFLLLRSALHGWVSIHRSNGILPSYSISPAVSEAKSNCLRIDPVTEFQQLLRTRSLLPSGQQRKFSQKSYPYLFDR